MRTNNSVAVYSYSETSVHCWFSAGLLFHFLKWTECELASHQQYTARSPSVYARCTPSGLPVHRGGTGSKPRVNRHWTVTKSGVHCCQLGSALSSSRCIWCWHKWQPRAEPSYSDDDHLYYVFVCITESTTKGSDADDRICTSNFRYIGSPWPRSLGWINRQRHRNNSSSRQQPIPIPSSRGTGLKTCSWAN